MCFSFKTNNGISEEMHLMKLMKMTNELQKSIFFSDNLTKNRCHFRIMTYECLLDLEVKLIFKIFNIYAILKSFKFVTLFSRKGYYFIKQKEIYFVKIINSYYDIILRLLRCYHFASEINKMTSFQLYSEFKNMILHKYLLIS